MRAEGEEGGVDAVAGGRDLAIEADDKGGMWKGRYICRHRSGRAAIGAKVLRHKNVRMVAVKKQLQKVDKSAMVGGECCGCCACCVRW